MSGPSPLSIYPLRTSGNVVFLKPFIKASNICVGDYTYFDGGRRGPEDFETYNVLYNYDESAVKLVLGKFCAIAAETRFLMTGDHKLNGFSTYPFPIFGEGWERAFPFSEFSVKGDIIVGNDVWFGYDSFVRNGVSIGNGAIIAAKSVVVKDVPAYSIVAGNPARVVKMRFDEWTVSRLEAIAWWNWSADKLSRNSHLICGGDLEALEAAQ